mmetsp:Transcript_11061/g.18284  ORF Transcript_11061/g.18284 Transcript_11061/m.18284 type:complete len:241 (-) Transcript_11061:41-763(-)
MALVKPAPGVLGGVSLLTAIELICLVHLIVCMVIVCNASSTTPVDYAGVRISGYMQCINAAWFLLGIPLIIIGGVGAVFRVEQQLKVYLAYLVATVFVIVAWIFIFLRYGNACNTIQPISGSYKQQALMVCQASNGIVIFMMLVLFGVVLGCIYLVWSMMEYVKNRHAAELLRYQEPWEAVAMLADDAAEDLAKERLYIEQQKAKHFDAVNAQVPPGYFDNPYKIQHLSNKVPPYNTFGA